MEITPIYCHPYLGIHARNRFRKKTAYFFIVKSVISAGHGTASVLKHREVEDPRCFRRNHRTTDEGLPRFEFNCRQRTGDFLRLRRLTTHGAWDLPSFFLFFSISSRSDRFVEHASFRTRRRPRDLLPAGHIGVSSILFCFVISSLLSSLRLPLCTSSRTSRRSS